ncbi:hypothetical protein [Methylobacterium sp. WL7]|uniref:hypothetical protein n=1 Tax=Methylobacterium sp. WL7 TaxID=2603900 RepID=UPI001FEDC2F4|nr:hypothetical protein [Methylobacterium sp. WL7]
MLRGARVDLLYYGMEGLTSQAERAMRAAWHEFIFVPSLPPAKQSFATHWGIDDWCPDELCAAIEQHTSRHTYDAIVVNYSWMSRVFEFCDIPLKILDTHDVFADRRDKMVRAALEPRWFFTSASEEAKAFSRADIVIGIQDSETGLIAQRSASRVLTVGHPPDLSFLGGAPSTVPAVLFGYFASGNPWNKRSISALDAELSGQPRIDWVIAGTICDSSIIFNAAPLKLGRLSQPADFYEHVCCVINPMIGGTGLKIKTIEALSYGKPVIGTVPSFEGLSSVHPFHSFNSIADMACGMQDYAASASLQTEIAEASRELAVGYAADVAAQFDELFDVIKETSRGY